MVSSSLGLYLSAWTFKDSSDLLKRRLLTQRSRRTSSTFGNILYRHLRLHRTQKSSRLWTRQPCSLCSNERNAQSPRFQSHVILPPPNLIYGCRTTKPSYHSLNMHSTPHPPSPCKNSGSMSIQPCILFLSSTSLYWS